MVKGVNKTVIEVNNTGSKVFDRVVFYVSPSCSNMSAKNLRRAMQNFSFQFENVKPCTYKSLRQRMILRRRMVIAGIAVSLAAIVATLIIIL